MITDEMIEDVRRVSAENHRREYEERLDREREARYKDICYAEAIVRRLDDMSGHRVVDVLSDNDLEILKRVIGRAQP